MTTIPMLEKELEQEMERLNKRIEDLNTINEEHKILNGMIRKELQQKENIIKEVREFAKLRKEMYERQENAVGQEVIISLLEILEKEVN